MSSEQWKEQGICKECRRQNYCSKECKAHKTTLFSEMNKLVTQKLDERTNGVYSQIMEHSPYKM